MEDKEFLNQNRRTMEAKEFFKSEAYRISKQILLPGF